MDYKRFFIFILLVLFAQMLVWLQSYGQFVWNSLKKDWVLLSLAIPISYIWIYIHRHGYETLNGQAWMLRFIISSVGIIVFSLCSVFIMKEAFTMKTAVSIALSVILICIQVFWKT